MGLLERSVEKREIPSGRGFLQDSSVRATPWAYLCKLSEYCTTVDVKNTFFFFNCFGMLFLISLAVLFASVALLHFFPNPNQVWQLTSQFRSLLLGPIFLLLSWRVSDQSDTCQSDDLALCRTVEKWGLSKKTGQNRSVTTLDSNNHEWWFLSIFASFTLLHPRHFARSPLTPMQVRTTLFTTEKIWYSISNIFKDKCPWNFKSTSLGHFW